MIEELFWKQVQNSWHKIIEQDLKWIEWHLCLKKMLEVMAIIIIDATLDSFDHWLACFFNNIGSY